RIKSAALTPKYSTYAWSSSQPTHASELPHAHASKQGICVEEEFKPSLSYEDPRIGVEVHA
ncbi:hypothetical protein PIB30_112044, partial [Stylosanthes scabra]|nr:hypothetical protein [Stylosanthes scabra]